MDVLILVVLVITGVLFSSILERFIPRVSLPLVQVALGVIWYFTPFLPTVRLDSELFMVLFISPLLFNAARNTTIPRLMRVLKQSLWLAIGLVFLCIAATGVTLHAFWPQIGLAAALALGATLAPTDAVAVTQMGKQAQLSERQMETLKGESLFNDAASIVSFQFAVLAALTGEFSPFDFTLEVVTSFVGGIVVGVVLGKVIDWFVTMLRRHRLETTTNRITIEILTPFLVYALSERLGLSAVLSVVAAGLSIGFHRRGVGVDIASVNLVSNSVWEFLEYSLNGSVFMLLGIQLPIIFLDTTHRILDNIGRITVAAVLLTVVSLTVRFLAVAFMLAVTKDEMTGKRRSMTHERWHSALVMTFGGAKGAITISLAFTLPVTLGWDESGTSIRTLMWAIAAIFVLISLVLTNIMLPLLAPRGEVDSEEFTEARRLVLNTTIERLAQSDTPENHQAVQRVMRSYTYRAARLDDPRDDASRSADESRLRRETLTWELEWLHDYDEANPQMRAATKELMDNISVTLKREDAHGLRKIRRRMSTFAWKVRPLWRKLIEKTGLSRATAGERRAHDLMVVHTSLMRATVSHLFGLVNDPRYDAADVTSLMGEYRSVAADIRPRGMDPDKRERLQRQVSQTRAEAFRIELDVIRDFVDQNQITREQASVLRQNVHLMQADMGF
ncbi:MAG: sodium:proton antiporter [Bifidobacteriaceae bacterium]|nr:sodium:proton antiporter [Bifidobacteriaceae bacterium]